MALLAQVRQLLEQGQGNEGAVRELRCVPVKHYNIVAGDRIVLEVKGAVRYDGLTYDGLMVTVLDHGEELLVITDGGIRDYAPFRVHDGKQERFIALPTAAPIYRVAKKQSAA